MKIDEVINNLEKIKAQYGNLDVKCLRAKVCYSSGALVGTRIGEVDTVKDIDDKFVLIGGENIEV